MRLAPRFVRTALDSIAANVSDCEHYANALFTAISDSEPIFTTSEYESFFWKCATTVPGWTPHVLTASASSESHGSDVLLRMVKAVDYHPVAEEAIVAHARDEAVHARMFLGIVRDSFPSFLSPAQAEEIRSGFVPVNGDTTKSGLCLPEDILIDYLVQINLSEVRTLMNLHLLAPIIWGSAPEENRERIIRTLQSLERDEIRHISYTGRLMEGWAASGDAALVAELFAKNMAEFNAYSVSGTRSAVQEYGQGRFPRLLAD